MKMRRAEREANRIIDEMEITSPPVMIEDIAKRHGAKIHYEPFEGDDDISGVLYNDEKNCIIGINSSHSRTRQRFTIAHELGHLVLHNKKFFVDKAVKVSFRDKRSSMAIDNNEIEANQFAAEILMPRTLIEKEIRKLIVKKNYIQNKELFIKELASKFAVSFQSMEFRLNNLGILISL